MARDDLVKAMSLELDWTKPSQAENLLDRGLNAGHVEAQDDGLAPSFDPSDVEVPFGFAPSEELFEPVETETEPAETDGGTAREEGVLDTLLDRIAEATGEDRNKAVAAANERQEDIGGLVTIEAAALSVAHSHGLDVREEAEQVLDGLREQG